MNARIKKLDLHIYTPLALVLLVGLVLRLMFLDRIPSGISFDELDYIITAKSITIAGSDISGTWNPMSFSTPPGEVPKAELIYAIIAPFMIAPLNLLFARIPYVLFSMLMIVLVYLIAKKVLNPKIALYSALVMAVNPWSIYFARTAYEAPIAVVFYLAAFYVLLITKGLKILLCLPLLLLGFFSYIGTKLILIPMLIVFLSYLYYINMRKFLVQYMLVFLMSVVLVVFFWISLNSHAEGSRLSEISTLNDSSIITKVDTARRLAIQTPLLNMYENKLTVYIKGTITRMLDIFSSDYLFIHGEERSTFSLWKHGVFYYFEIILLLIGFGWLFAKKRLQLGMLSAVILVATLPSLISNVGVQYGLRSAMIFPWIIMIIAAGIYYLVNEPKNIIVKSGIGVILFILYLGSLSNFLHIYFLENPIYNSEGFAFSSRILSRYAHYAVEDGKDIKFLGMDRSGVIKPYLFYSNELTYANFDNVQDVFNKNGGRYKSLSFIECNSEIVIDENDIIVMPMIRYCDLLINIDSHHVSIAQLSDGGEIYRIFNDSICSEYLLSRYPTGIGFDDLRVENLSRERFCSLYITDLSN